MTMSTSWRIRSPKIIFINICWSWFPNSNFFQAAWTIFREISWDLSKSCRWKDQKTMRITYLSQMIVLFTFTYSNMSVINKSRTYSLNWIAKAFVTASGAKHILILVVNLIWFQLSFSSWLLFLDNHFTGTSRTPANNKFSFITSNICTYFRYIM